MHAIVIRYFAERLLPLLRVDSHGDDYVATNGFPDGFPDSVSDSLPHGVPHGIPHGVPDRHSPVQVPWRSMLSIVQWHFA